MSVILYCSPTRTHTHETPGCHRVGRTGFCVWYNNNNKEQPLCLGENRRGQTRDLHLHRERHRGTFTHLSINVSQSPPCLHQQISHTLRMRRRRTESREERGREREREWETTAGAGRLQRTQRHQEGRTKPTDVCNEGGGSEPAQEIYVTSAEETLTGRAPRPITDADKGPGFQHLWQVQ